jgi:putative flippase GtrA
MKDSMRLAALYALFVGVSYAMNIMTQEAVCLVYLGRGQLELAMLTGTAVGVVVKYLLDKRYIFRAQTKSAAHDARLFILYTSMSVLTTLVFWGCEYGADFVFQTKSARYTGATLGFGIGSILKYQLDKRFVFKSK